ncbi:MAG: hypothetical protein ACSHXI_20855 [Hoeflea sp.]
MNFSDDAIFALPVTCRVSTFPQGGQNGVKEHPILGFPAYPYACH